jgi:hypothetical protein
MVRGAHASPRAFLASRRKTLLGETPNNTRGIRRGEYAPQSFRPIAGTPATIFLGEPGELGIS